MELPPVKVKRGRKKVDLEMVERKGEGEEKDVKEVEEGKKRKKARRKDRKGAEEEENTQTWVEEEVAQK